MNKPLSLLVEEARAAEAVSVKAAIELYGKIFDAHPSHEWAWLQLLRLLERKGQLAERDRIIERGRSNGLSLPAGAPALVKPAKARNLKEPRDFLAALEETPNDIAVRGKIGRFIDKHLDEFDSEAKPLYGKLAKLALPDTIRIETASACNLRCIHCTTGTAYDSTDRRVMKTETFDLLIEQIKKIPTLRTAVLYLGGEPLLNKSHATFCRRIKQETHVQKTKFVTNGELLTEEWCEKLAEADLTSISISIDGLSPEEHNALRLRSNYETIRRNIWMLHDHFQKRGVRTKIQIGNTQVLDGDHRWYPGVVAPVPEFLAEEFPDFDIGSCYAMVWPGMTDNEIGPGLVVENNAHPRKYCDHPFYDLAVRANGDIVLCCYDISGKHVMGNVHRDDILELYQSPEYVAVRESMLNRDAAAAPKICQNCANFTGSTLQRG